MKDKFSAVWVSYTSINEYLRCPRAYFLKNVYRDAHTHHKITLMQPSLALGQSIHEVIEEISTLPSDKRFAEPLENMFERVWEKVSGKKGGFRSDDEEYAVKKRGLQMIERITRNPGPLQKKAIKMRQDLPYFWLQEDENIILCGKIDWLQYDDVTEGVRILDFKTGKHDEDPDSLQLPIYYLLTTRCQSRPVVGVSYWYLDRDDEPIDGVLPSEDDAFSRVYEVAKHIALARKLERFVCKRKDGCMACLPLESVIAKKAEFVGVNDFGQDVYISAAQQT